MGKKELTPNSAHKPKSVCAKKLNEYLKTGGKKMALMKKGSSKRLTQERGNSSEGTLAILREKQLIR